MMSTAPIPSQSSRNPAETVTIRLAVSADAAALSSLAQLDSAPVPEAVPMLVAEVGGQLRAALPLDGGRAIADPFQRTAALVAMLVERTREPEPPASRWAARYRRLLHARQSAPLARA